MALTPGTRLGPYEILAALGAGGMGEVYRACDPRLGRDVAIKIVPVEYATDGERRRRFEQEARAAAALNHPNILAVYDIGTDSSTTYIVSELLEGQTLRGALAEGALPVRKALEYGIQICHGIAAAHEKGIVHRDLKPENLFLTGDGRVKILDFGLAKLRAEAVQNLGPAGVDEGLRERGKPLTERPTEPPDTQPGIALGTIGYMSPEQMLGRPADQRADIFALGCVFYEMLSGRRPFSGEAAIDTVTAILKNDAPDLATVERPIPPALDRIVRRCLEKNPQARFQTASDLAFAIENLSTDSGVRSAAISAVEGGRSRERLGWTLAGVASVVALALMSTLGFIYVRGAPSPVPRVTFSIAPPERARFYDGGTRFFAVSPDGTQLVFVARDNVAGSVQLWVQSIGSLSARPLAGTESAFYPFFSPDGRFVAFFSGGKLKTIPVGGGPPETVCDVGNVTGFSTMAGNGAGGAWNGDGVILFSQSLSGPIYRVPSSGGTPVPATTLNPSQQEDAHLWPYFLPDGKRFLYFARSTSTNQSGIFVKALDEDTGHLLLRANSNIAYASPGYVVYSRQGTLMAQPFDVTRTAITGEPFPIAEDVTVGGIGQTAFAVSGTGVLAYRKAAPAIRSRLVWRDRTGKDLGTIGEADRYLNPRLAPDGRRIAVQLSGVRADSGSDVWLIDSSLGTSTRFTFDPVNESGPVWAPDGNRIAFAVGAPGPSTLVMRAASGAGAQELLIKLPESGIVDDWSPDGSSVVYHAGPGLASSLWHLPLDSDRKPRRLLDESRFALSHARISPDGRWVAYTSNESGKDQVYIQNFPAPAGKWQISRNGGAQPVWRRDGKEIFYVAPDSKLMGAPIKLGAAVELGAPVALFEVRMEGATSQFGGIWHQYDVTPDGQRFLINALDDDGADMSTVTVVLNWTTGVTK